MKTAKYFIGIFIAILILTIATISILSTWDIHILSWDLIYKIIICGAIIGATTFILWIVKHLFFKKGI